MLHNHLFWSAKHLIQHFWQDSDYLTGKMATLGKPIQLPKHIVGTPVLPDKLK